MVQGWPEAPEERPTCDFPGAKPASHASTARLGPHPHRRPRAVRPAPQGPSSPGVPRQEVWDAARAQSWGERPGFQLQAVWPWLSHFSGPISSSLILHGAFIPAWLGEQDAKHKLPHKPWGSLGGVG